MNPTKTDTTLHDDHVQRLRELVAVRDVLRPDRDDPRVLSELTAIEAEITARRREVIR